MRVEATDESTSCDCRFGFRHGSVVAWCKSRRRETAGPTGLDFAGSSGSPGAAGPPATSVRQTNADIGHRDRAIPVEGRGPQESWGRQRHHWLPAGNDDLGTLTHDAHIQMIDESKREFRSKDGTEFNFRDTWNFNVAAYKIDRLIGLGLVPVSVERRWKSTPAAYTWWLDDVMMDEGDRLKKKISPPDLERWNASDADGAALRSAHRQYRPQSRQPHDHQRLEHLGDRSHARLPDAKQVEDARATSRGAIDRSLRG